jgi:hypothetical protein
MDESIACNNTVISNNIFYNIDYACVFQLERVDSDAGTGPFYFMVLELIIINYNMYGLIYNKYILYNELSNYIYVKWSNYVLLIGFNMCHKKWVI